MTRCTSSFLCNFVAVLGLFGILVSAIPANSLNVRSAPLPGYTLVDMTVTVPRLDGTGDVTLVGTIQEMVAQAEPLVDQGVIAHPSAEFSTNPATARELFGGKRDNYHYFCNIGSWTAIGVTIEDGIAYLRNFGFKPCDVGAGPRVCARVSCDLNAAIWLCNDNATPIGPPCNKLGDMAQDVLNLCGFIDQFDNNWRVNGQEFNDLENYNVIDGGDYC